MVVTVVVEVTVAALTECLLCERALLSIHMDFPMTIPIPFYVGSMYLTPNLS